MSEPYSANSRDRAIVVYGYVSKECCEIVSEASISIKKHWSGDFIDINVFQLFAASLWLLTLID
jgi:hypothetical protein